MAERENKKGGFRAMFGMRSGKEPKESGARKKLSKKGSRSDVLGESNTTTNVTNTNRQDSGSFTTETRDPTENGFGLPIYEDVAGLAPYALRDYPYAAVDALMDTNNAYLQPGLQAADYRRNSEGKRQYAAPLYQSHSSRSASIPQLQNEKLLPNTPGKAHRSKLSKAHRAPSAAPRPDDILDKDTGERKDLTEMMHAFTYVDGVDEVEEKPDDESLLYDPLRPDGTATLANVSPEVWLHVADFLSPLDVANLSSTCRTMYARLGRHPYKLLLDPRHRSHRLDFLLAMEPKMPRHLFCFPCAQWHLRIQPGLETLKPHNVLNPLFECPNLTNIHVPPPRIRITDGRTLPFAFIQLARRHWAHGPEYGITHQSLARRWKDAYSSWSHESTYHITEKGNLLMRIRSQHYVEGGMTDAAKRLLLFSRGDYTPYFSVCSHWKHGVLTSIPKCALTHIPHFHESETTAVDKFRERNLGRKANGLVPLCSVCRPMRRCPKCPTEYLFELKLVEDKSVRSHAPERFKQALIVTRWSDLGPARSPEDAQWSAITGDNDTFDSFAEIGRRAVSGVFESAFTDTIPGQRILSMNPQSVTANEESGNWY
ncbi:F-box domain [Pyrenophora seminiperda CCB06]|uniref:F-box domain n=1 Tax=Pyrenophora seminiperda CCB06 TaxID=1302712 RepID=A0A3M7M7G5_9PLEO|nr:F-box domain [Pyrenophora seminiperda CCB06]